MITETLNRQELIKKALSVMTPVTDYLVLNDRRTALEKLSDEQLIKVIETAHIKYVFGWGDVDIELKNGKLIPVKYRFAKSSEDEYKIKYVQKIEPIIVEGHDSEILDKIARNAIEIKEVGKVIFEI